MIKEARIYIQTHTKGKKGEFIIVGFHLINIE